MMELRHVAMVNWHLFDVEDIEITGHVGVFGENRSGKSTILDMAQVVLTGGNRNVQRLNAVAGDKGKSRSASKRSVVDYCLGTLGEEQRKRDQHQREEPDDVEVEPMVQGDLHPQHQRR